MMILPQMGVLFFAPISREAEGSAEEPGKLRFPENFSVQREVPSHESESRNGLHRVQTAQLQHDEEQEERSGPS